jgi:hypothetical protein
MPQDNSQAVAPARGARPLATGLVVVAAVAAALFRLVPHPPNLTPIDGLGMYGGARLRWWQALLLPLGVMAVTDLVLYALLDYRPFDVFVYASLLVNVLLGRLLRRTESPWRIGAASVLGSVQFFLVTNFGMWLTSALSAHPIYEPTLAGLVQCYLAGLAFYQQGAPLGYFGNTLLGDLAFTGLLFGLHAALARAAFPAERVPLPAAAR